MTSSQNQAEHEVEVLAAGGVILRDGTEGPEVAIVHRPEYDDWTLPKGKLDPGEDFEEAALREVLEETGLRCRLEQEIGRTSYADHKGRSKLVRYWAMSVIDGEFAPNTEVDELRWVGSEEAAATLSHEFDRELAKKAARR